MKIEKFLIILLVLTGCIQDKTTVSANLNEKRKNQLKYAEGFDIQFYEGFNLVTVYNPWQRSENIKYTYILGTGFSNVPDSLKDLPHINVPVKTVITFSTSHIAFIDTLVGTGSIIGVSGDRYVYNRDLRDSLATSFTRDIGYDQGINYELLIDLDPDVIFIYGVESSIAGSIVKLNDLGLTPVLCGDYLETHPLGKCEWIKFFAQFYQREELAENIFRGIDSAYMSIADRYCGEKNRPGVMTGLPWKGSWYIPGGSSYVAQLIRDAGGDYLWDNVATKEAVPMDLESVFSRAVHADIWINPGAAGTIDELLATDERFNLLPVVNKRMVYNNDRRIGPGGGNDYWESGVLRPDIIIADLQAIFYPELFSDHAFTYYRKLK